MHHTQQLNQKKAVRIASELGVEFNEVQEMEARLSSTDLPLDTSALDDEDSAAAQQPSKSVLVALTDQSSHFAAEWIEEKWKEATTNALPNAMKKLDERSQHIIFAPSRNESLPLYPFFLKPGVKSNRCVGRSIFFSKVKRAIPLAKAHAGKSV